MNITVYLGASFSNDPKLKEEAAKLGSFIAKRKSTLVYGGSKSGLMGVLATAALQEGGKVIGVEPQFFIDECVQLENLTELIVTKDMDERKAKMLELGNAFIAFPGGTGTLEEVSQIMSLLALGKLDAPCILYNIDGYYDSLKTLLCKMVDFELSSPKRLEKIYFATDLDRIEEILKKHKII